MIKLTVTSINQEQTLPKWKPATWEDYLADCEDPNIGEVRLFFDHSRQFIPRKMRIFVMFPMITKVIATQE